MNQIKPTYCLILLVTISFVIVYGCNQPQNYKFELTKHATNKGLALAQPTVKSYSAGYNPKAYGNIIITLNDGSEYKAKGLEPANMSVLLQLLSLKKIEIDTANNELSVKGITL